MFPIIILISLCVLKAQANFFAGDCASYSQHVEVPCNFNASILDNNWYLVQRMDVGLEKHSECGRVDVDVYANGTGTLLHRRLQNNVTQVVSGAFIPRSEPGDYTITKNAFDSANNGNAIWRIIYADSGLVVSWQCFSSSRGTGSEQDLWVFKRQPEYTLEDRSKSFKAAIANGLDYWSLVDTPYDPYKCAALNLASGPTVV